MIKIYDMIEKAKESGYDETNAEAKVCQDLILSLISQSQYNRNVTVKGGVVMRSITNNTRRATQDMDLDFIKYSLKDDSIDRFINKLNVSFREHRFNEKRSRNGFRCCYRYIQSNFS